MIFRREYLKNQNDNLYGRLKQMYLGKYLNISFIDTLKRTKVDSSIRQLYVEFLKNNMTLMLG